MGLTVSSDHFLKVTDKILEKNSMGNYIKNFDDLLVFAKTLKELCFHLQRLFEIACDNHMSFQPKQFGFSSPEGAPVKYGGLRISHEGIQPDPEKIKVIEDLKAPTNVTEVRSMLGLFNQSKRWWPEISANTVNMRRLLMKGAKFE